MYFPHAGLADTKSTINKNKQSNVSCSGTYGLGDKRLTLEKQNILIRNKLTYYVLWTVCSRNSGKFWRTSSYSFMMVRSWLTLDFSFATSAMPCRLVTKTWNFFLYNFFYTHPLLFPMTTTWVHRFEPLVEELGQWWNVKHPWSLL